LYATHSTETRRRSSVLRENIASYPFRRDRRISLKQRGDYLGVTGFNPETGEMDVITPSSSSHSSASLATGQGIDTVDGRSLKQGKLPYKAAANQKREDLEKLLHEQARLKAQKREQQKQSLREVQRRVTWRKNSRNWSSMKEPDLSPIAQSQTSISRNQSFLRLWLTRA
jgi:hypothetical protein